MHPPTQKKQQRPEIYLKAVTLRDIAVTSHGATVKNFFRKFFTSAHLASHLIDQSMCIYIYIYCFKRI